MKTSHHGAYVHNDNHAKQGGLSISNRFWVQEPRYSQNRIAKKRYTSNVARVGPV